MGGYVDKLQPKAGEVMEPSERLLAAIRTMPRGSTVGTAIGGAVGAVVTDKQAKKAQAQQTERSVAATWPAMRAALGLTDQRLLMFDYTLMGKPKSLVGQIPLDQVQSLNIEKGVVNKLHFGFTDGSAVQIECAKLEKVGDFASALDSAKPGTVS
ncbi:MAG: hypothetical protein M3285_08770 [Actinomycetota bacterium]|nr:hypothetical protein [Actinomycetota bacterium]